MSNDASDVKTKKDGGKQDYIKKAQKVFNDFKTKLKSIQADAERIELEEIRKQL